jgi:hypothetical protein
VVGPDLTFNSPFSNDVFVAKISSSNPTASTVAVAGRVLSANGLGIFKVRISITNAAGETRTVLTNSFGYYCFTDVAVSETYIFSVSSKRYQFTQPTQMLTIIEKVNDLNFTASP